MVIRGFEKEQGRHIRHQLALGRTLICQRGSCFCFPKENWSAVAGAFKEFYFSSSLCYNGRAMSDRSHKRRSRCNQASLLLALCVLLLAKSYCVQCSFLH